MAAIFGHLVLALAAVIIVGRVLGAVCRRIGQPVVVGEVIGGILLGPSILGLVWPEGHGFLLPPALQPILGRVAELGVVLYMFLVGLEFDERGLTDQLVPTATIAVGSIVVPFVLGAALAIYLPSALTPAGVSQLGFVLFVGIAMSIVAFPVLARVLAETGLTRSELGVRAIGAAAVSDLIIWCGLAVVVGVLQAEAGHAVEVSVGAVAFVAVLLVVVRPVARNIVNRQPPGKSSPIILVLTLGFLFVVAWISNWIGIHAVIGAFLFGAIIPHESAVSRTLTAKLTHVVSFVLLPAFFAFVGMKTELGLVSSLGGWAITIAIILIASVGKIGGTYLTARLVGRPGREAALLGILMNTRGLMELVVLNIGLELGVITPALFAMMVVMALATTMMTMPLLKRASVPAA